METHPPQVIAGWIEDKSIRLIDVREAGEWSQGHIAGAMHVPLGQLGQRLAKIPSDKPIVFYCLSGGRSASAVAAAAGAGLSNVSHMGGGITAWRMHGLPVAR